MSPAKNYEEKYKDLLEDFNLFLCAVQRLNLSKESYNSAVKNKAIDARILQKRYEDYKESANVLAKAYENNRYKLDFLGEKEGLVFTPF